MDINELKEFLPIVIPLISINLILVITALINIFKHPNYKFGNKIMWIIIVVIFELIGPICYFIFGKGDE